MLDFSFGVEFLIFKKIFAESFGEGDRQAAISETENVHPQFSQVIIK
jgi:hypothetical protein